MSQNNGGKPANEEILRVDVPGVVAAAIYNNHPNLIDENVKVNGDFTHALMMTIKALLIERNELKKDGQSRMTVWHIWPQSPTAR